MRNRAFALGLGLLSTVACADGDPKVSDAVTPGTGGMVALGGSAALGGLNGFGGSSSAKGGAPPTSDADLLERVKAAETLDAASLIASYAPTTVEPPTLDTASVVGLDRIQRGYFALTDAQRQKLSKQSVVIQESIAFPNFTYAYKTMYAEHVPLFVTADSILNVIHRSFDEILAAIEQNALSPALEQVLTSARARLAACPVAQAESCADVDLLLTVGLGLLHGEDEAPVGFAKASDTSKMWQQARQANGVASVELFGGLREYDFSQLTPRGHYTSGQTLTRYFQAMMWLGRTDFRLIETRDDGSTVFVRRQFQDALILSSVIDPAPYRRIDATVSAFVGEHDSMTVEDMLAFQTELGIDSVESSLGVESQVIESALRASHYGQQRIASQVMTGGIDSTLPLARAFALFGQRYVVDSHVFSNLVYDRVGHGRIERMMPSPLDVAFSVLNQPQALPLLAPELERYPYAPDLGAMRILVDALPGDFWQANLYNRWLTAIRSLGGEAPAANAFRTEAWGRRLLNSALASWAELRHDTILYAKQSYTGTTLCEFPDAYVDPYPHFFQAVAEYANHGLELFDELDLPTSPFWDEARRHFTELRTAATTLQSMAEHELSGQPFDEKMLAFVNDAVVYSRGGCSGNAVRKGWYPRLFFGAITAGQTYLDGDQANDNPTPIIADVHTQPTENDVLVGKVLHVGTGLVASMVVAVDTCTGPRAYVGPVSAYRETITRDFKRLNDDEWLGQVAKSPAPAWMEDVLSK